MQLGVHRRVSAQYECPHREHAGAGLVAPEEHAVGQPAELDVVEVRPVLGHHLGDQAVGEVGFATLGGGSSSQRSSMTRLAGTTAFARVSRATSTPR